MEALLPLIQAAGVFVAIASGLWWRDRVWRRLSRRFGLTYEAQRPWGPRRLHGDVHGISVELETHHTAARGGKKPRLRRTRCIAGRGALPATLSAARINRLKNMWSTLMGTRVKVGDPVFDAKFQLSGDTTTVSAALNEAGRQRLVQLAEEDGGFVESGAVHAGRRGWFGGERALGQLLERTLRTASELAATPDDYPARLRYSAISDSAPGVKQRCARLLLEQYSDTPEALDLAENRRHHADPEIAMLAALVSKDVLAVLEMVDAHHQPVAARALAIERLAGVDRAAGSKLAVRFSAHKNGQLRLAACRAAEAFGLTDVLEAWLERRAKVTSEERATIGRAALNSDGPIAAACAAWCLGDLDAEELDRARTLIRRDGDLRSVGPLAPQAKGPLRSGAVKRTARSLLNHLQDKLNLSHNPGGLSLADDRTGELSLPDAAAEGALSDAEDNEEMAT